jgi:uncharacterized membrane protein YphA (DoxX/SURF4 family)
MTSRLPAAYGLSLIRIGMGAYFLATAYDKTTKGWLTDGRPLVRMLRGSVPHAASWYAPFLRDTVIPNAALFARLTNLAEWAVGISLLLGLLTQAGALVGVWLNLNYMAMKGLANSAGSVDRLFVLGELVMLVAAAGLVLGLDGVVWGRLAPALSHRDERTAGTPSPAQR